MLAKAKVAELDVSIFVDEQVIRFQVPMDVVQIVHAFYCQHRLRSVKPRFLFAQNVLSHQESHQVTAWQKLHDEVEKLFVLKAVFKFDNPRVLGEGENISFSPDMSHLILKNHLCFLHFFYRHDLTRFFAPAYPNFAERASADDGSRLKVPDADLGAAVRKCY